MHPRDPRRLESGTFDVAVVGGGIHGLALAYEAASRGLGVALVEAADFGGGVSFNQQKTAHGGLRALQTGRLDRARAGIVERRALARIAPHLLRPLPFVIGTYRSLSRNRAALRAALRLDALIGVDRNAGVTPALHLPSPRLLPRETVVEWFPGIRSEGLTGGALWYDYQMAENDRLTMAFAAAADRAGAILANYVEAVGTFRANNRIAGLLVADRVSGRQMEVRAAVTINAAGAHAARVMGLFDVRRPLPLIRVMSLMTSRPAPERALAAPTKAGKMLTLVPWRGCALVGTSHSDRAVAPNDADVPSAEVDRLVGEANEAFPALALARGDVTLVHRGLVPAKVAPDGTADLMPWHRIFDHADDGIPGALTVVGVKYTTARGVADETITRVAVSLERQINASSTASAPLPGGAAGDHEALIGETARRHGIALSPAISGRLARLYGELSPLLVAIIASHPGSGEALDAGGSITGAEVIHAIRNEMSVRLSDIVLRRLSLSDRHPGRDVVRACAAIAARGLGWSDEETQEQIAEVERAYHVP